MSLRMQSRSTSRFEQRAVKVDQIRKLACRVLSGMKTFPTCTVLIDTAIFNLNVSCFMVTVLIRMLISKFESVNSTPRELNSTL